MIIHICNPSCYEKNLTEYSSFVITQRKDGENNDIFFYIRVYSKKPNLYRISIKSLMLCSYMLQGNYIETLRILTQIVWIDNNIFLLYLSQFKGYNI